MGKSCGLCMVAYWLVIIGGLNWGLVGLFKWNLVNAIFGSVSWLESLIYILVGVSAIIMVAGKSCKMCTKKV
ncbi:DUF378 domain-containing protein [Candidatus Uhrbacteria bacterium]|nr:DUF378 domain-containing protein [Candidatus Uhrbacteria bacterium]